MAEDETTLPAVTPISSLAAKRRSAPPRLVYLGTAVLILVLLATNAAVIWHLRESELLHQEDQLKTLSLILAEQADRSLESVDLVISSVADGVAAEGVTDGASFDQKMTGHDVYLLLQEKMSGIPQLDAVTVISRNGKLLNFSRAWPAPEVDVSDRRYFQVLKENLSSKGYISEPVQNRGTGSWTIFLAHRVNGANGEFLGIILGAIEMRYFEDFYRAISLGEGGSIALQQMSGQLLARFPPTDTIGRVFSNSERLLRGGISGTVREFSPIDGQMRIKAAHRLSNYPVFALATITEEAALAHWRAIARLMSLGALGCAAAIAITGFALGRQWKQHAMLADAQAEIQRQEDLTAAFEAMRSAKEDAETANQAKSEFLANMSHELRTPLNAVLGFSEIMVNEGFGPLGNERYRAYARDIHTSGSHLLGIINDILDLSKAAAGKLELAEERFEAGDAVRSVCRLIQPRIDEAKLSLTIKTPPGDLILYADERLVRQMLLNLLSNACKFTPPDGHIDCVLSVDDGGVTFAVTDTGVGIPSEHLGRVLEPFAQVDSSLSRGQEGTGLGLALVKVMAELHGGSLHLDSEVGKGTTASLILPLARVEPESADIAPEDVSFPETAGTVIA